MIGIKVYHTDGSSQILDLMPDFRIDLEGTLPAFDHQLENGIYSLPIEIPFTQRNKEWLGYAENMNTANNSIPEYWRCDVIANGITQIADAKLKKLSHKGLYNTREGSYNFMISGVKGLFGTLIKGKSLRDLTLDGPINWPSGFDSRRYATQVMQRTIRRG